MQEDLTNQNTSKTRNFLSKRLIIIGITAVFIILGSISFMLGRRSRSTSVQTEMPSAQTAQATPTPTMVLNAKTTRGPGSPTPTPILKTKIIPAVASLDGFRSSGGEGNNNLQIRVGRNSTIVSRGFVSYSLEGLSSSVTVVEAILRIYQTETEGQPYSAGGTLKIDHLTYGDSLDDTDYGMAALLSNITTLTPSSTKSEWKEADVTQAVKDNIANGRSCAQFRIHFTTENTGNTDSGDFVYFESAENTDKSGNIPQLVVKYN